MHCVIAWHLPPIMFLHLFASHFVYGRKGCHDVTSCYGHHQPKRRHTPKNRTPPRLAPLKAATLRDGTPPPEWQPTKDSIPLRTTPQQGLHPYDQQAGGTHPTGMFLVWYLSCLFLQRTGRCLKAPSGQYMWSPVRRLASFRRHTSCAT